MKGFAWLSKLNAGDEKDPLMYTVQIAGINKASLRRLKKEFKGWKQIGEGVDTSNNEFITLWTRSFEDKTSWVTFARGLQFEVVELTPRGNKVTISNGK